MLFYENWQVLQNVNFTDQCCATASDFLWHFSVLLALSVIISSVIAWRYNISIMSVIILVLYYYVSIILLSILVLLSLLY